MRKLPNITPPTTLTSRQLDIVEQTREYRLITPLYGGGVAPNEADPVTIVRATEVRGHLRFWWRATRGGQAGGSLEKLKAMEDAIWGKAYKKGDQGIPPEQVVQIVVDADLSQQGKAVKPFSMERGRPKPANDIPSYAAFPLQPDQEQQKQSQPFIPDVLKGVRFTLIISYPDTLSTEIEAALWAWETFGGIGARTRRGFGALYLSAINGVPVQNMPLPTADSVKQRIQEKANTYIKLEDFPAGVPHLSRALQIVVIPSFADSMRAWSYLLKALRDFRQQKDGGRSAWPEADAIRTIAHQRTKNVQPLPQKFPRAAFGLPIIFHFTGDDAPADHTLNEENTQETDTQRKNRERFASPLILRPFLCRENQAVGLAILLEGTRVDLDHLVLQEKGQEELHEVKGNLTTEEAQQLTKKLADLHGETDVLQAFMNSLRKVR